MDMADAGDDMPVGDEHSGEFAGVEDAMDTFEDALAKLKAEFEKLEGGSDDDMEGAEDEMSDASDMEDGTETVSEVMEADDEEEDEEEEMDESWLAEFDDLEESVDLAKATVPSNAEVGAGKYAKAETNTKSPVASSQKDMFGAKPVVTGKGTAKSGYEREAAPSAAQLAGVKDNRRKKATDGMNSVSKEGSGGSLLSKSQGEGGKKSPLSSSPRK
jgi:hypothetical protein